MREAAEGENPAIQICQAVDEAEGHKQTEKILMMANLGEMAESEDNILMIVIDGHNNELPGVLPIFTDMLQKKLDAIPTPSHSPVGQGMSISEKNALVAPFKQFLGQGMKNWGHYYLVRGKYNNMTEQSHRVIATSIRHNPSFENVKRCLLNTISDNILPNFAHYETRNFGRFHNLLLDVVIGFVKHAENPEAEKTKIVLDITKMLLLGDEQQTAAIIKQVGERLGLDGNKRDIKMQRKIK